MYTRLLRVICASAFLYASSSATVRADVTIQQTTALNVASIIQMHGATTTSLTADKKREDTESHCEGVMSIVCGNVQSGEIVRLDKEVTWRLEPKKKRYQEQAFATPEELAAMRAKIEANLQKMRSCPVSQQQQPIDKSKCEISPPKFDAYKTDDKASIAGHDAQRTSATMTETCTNKDTGEVCDTIFVLDVWLTQEKLPGFSERTSFDSAYAKKLGLIETLGMLKGQAAQYLAPYQAQIKRLTDKSADFKGQPLKTSVRVLIGGKQCNSMAKTAEGSGHSSDNSNPMAGAAEAGKALGSLVGGLFHKKKAVDSTDSAATPAPSTGAPPPSTADPYAQFYTQLASFSIETVSITIDSVPTSRFEVPADWTKEVPKATQDDRDYTCPKT